MQQLLEEEEDKKKASRAPRDREMTAFFQKKQEGEFGCRKCRLLYLLRCWVVCARSPLWDVLVFQFSSFFSSGSVGAARGAAVKSGVGTGITETRFSGLANLPQERSRANKKKRTSPPFPPVSLLL